MDPEYQHDETFAETVSGIEDLRRQHGGDAWRDKAIDKALAAGEYLERRFNQFVLETNGKVSEAASAKVQAQVLLDVAALKADAARRSTMLAWAAGIFASLIVGLVLMYATHQWK